MDPSRHICDSSHARRDVFPVAVALRDLARRDAQQVYALQAESIELHVVPTTRNVLLARPLDDQSVSRLAAPDVQVNIREWPASHARLLADTGAHTCRLDALLWRLTQHGCKCRLLPELPADAHFKLRRWPEFDRIEHTPDHLRLATRLLRQKMTVPELAIVTGLPVSTINAFLNACCLVELLGVHALNQPKRPTGDTHSSRCASIFESIRSMLRFGVQ